MFTAVVRNPQLELVACVANLIPGEPHGFIVHCNVGVAGSRPGNLEFARGWLSRLKLAVPNGWAIRGFEPNTVAYAVVPDGEARTMFWACCDMPVAESRALGLLRLT